MLNVPVEFCLACGQVWLTVPVATQPDVLFDRLQASGAEMAQVHWDQAAEA